MTLIFGEMVAVGCVVPPIRDFLQISFPIHDSKATEWLSAGQTWQDIEETCKALENVIAHDIF